MKLHKSRYFLGTKQRQRRWPIRVVVIGLVSVLLLIGGMVFVRQYYAENLKPVSTSTESKEITIKSGTLAPAIATQFKEAGLIRSEAAFLWYVKSKNASEKILAGTYRLQPNLSTPEIVSIITKGKVATELVTILPGQRIDQVRETLIASGFSGSSVDRALQPRLYKNNPALVDKPDFASLEGYIYPESFLRNSSTRPEDVIEGALNEMNSKLTPEIRSAFAARGLSVYEGIILASIVEQEAYKQEDRNRVAQVFYSRLELGMRLESDPTAKYGAILAGKECPTSCNSFSSPYNTYEINGLPPTPISNVSSSSLLAVARPANTDWLFFVAGDDGTTHFSRTLEEHEALTEQYCTTLCGN